MIRCTQASGGRAAESTHWAVLLLGVVRPAIESSRSSSSDLKKLGNVARAMYATVTGRATGQLGASLGEGLQALWVTGGLQFGETSSVSHDLSHVCESVTALFGNQVTLHNYFLVQWERY